MPAVNRDASFENAVVAEVTVSVARLMRLRPARFAVYIAASARSSSASSVSSRFGNRNAHRQRYLANGLVAVRTTNAPLSNRPPDLLRDGGSTRKRRLWQQDRELLTTQPRRYITALDAGAQHVRDGSDDFVAQHVPIRVVHNLEMIDVSQ